MYIKFSFFLSVFFVLIGILTSITPTQTLSATPRSQNDGSTVSIPGQFSVNQRGGAQYFVNLRLPPGVDSHTPRMHLIYSSGASEGIAGTGWNINGLSNIALCQKNYRLDRQWSAITLNRPTSPKTNRFCLDGKRLVAVNGNYGDDGTEYRTAIFNGMRIVSHGRCGTGPCSFEAWGKLGNHLLYGTSDQSQIRPTGGDSDVAVWAIEKNTTLDGNAIQYTYNTSRRSDNVLYPRKISYGLDTSPIAINFHYRNVTYTNLQPPYFELSGYQTNRSRLISSISISLKNTPKYEYRLSHEQNPITRNYRLQSTQMCMFLAQGSDCSTATTYSYKDPTPQKPNFVPSKSFNALTGSTSWSDNRIVKFDKYGDGRPGLGLIANVLGSTTFSYLRPQGIDNFIVADTQQDLGPWYGGSSPQDTGFTFFYLMDKNGDGLTDILKVYLNNNDDNVYAEAYLSKRQQQGFTPDPSGAVLIGRTDKTQKKKQPFFVTSDVNGDGLQDFVAFLLASKGEPYNSKVLYSQAEGGFKKPVPLEGLVRGALLSHPTNLTNFMDINSSRLQDMTIMSGQQNKASGESFDVEMGVLYSDGSNFSGPEKGEALISLGDSGDWKNYPFIKWIDFNRDKLNDLLVFRFENGTVIGEIWINRGLAQGAMLIQPGAEGNDTTPFTIATDLSKADYIRNARVADVDGDGRNDLIINRFANSGKPPTSSDDTAFDIYLNTGLTFAHSNSTSSMGSNTRSFVLDANSDRIADIVVAKIENGLVTFSVLKNDISNNHDRIVAIENGLGQRTSITYAPRHTLTSWDTATPPSFPYKIYNNSEPIVSHYQFDNDLSSPYARTPSFRMKYADFAFDQHSFSQTGALTKSRIQPARDLQVDVTIVQAYPLTGRVVGKALYHVSKGYKYRDETTEYDAVPVIWGKTKKPITLIREIRKQSKVYYQDEQNVTRFSYGRGKSYSYAPLDTDDGRLGNVTTTTTRQIGSSDALYTCRLYENSILPLAQSSKNTWGFGRPLARREASYAGCTDFKNPKTYTFKKKTGTSKAYDIYFQATQYSSDGLYRKTRQQRYVTDRGWSGVDATYDQYGRVVKSIYHTDYANFDGQYSKEDRPVYITKTYDTNGYVSRVLKSSQPHASANDSQADSYTYDPVFSKLLSSTNVFGQSHEKKYDNFGRLISAYGPRLDAKGHLLEVVRSSYTRDPLGVLNTQEFRQDLGKGSSSWKTIKSYSDPSGQKLYSITQGPEGKDVSSGYSEIDADANRPVAAVRPFFEGTTPSTQDRITYDDRGYMKSYIRDDGVKFTHTLSYGDDLITKELTMPSPVDENSTTVRRYSYHVRDRMNVSENPLGQTKDYLDLRGKLVRSRDIKGFESSFEIDSVGTRTEVNTPDKGKSVYSVAAGQSMETVRLGNGDSQSYEYDDLGRLQRRSLTPAKGGSKTYQYSYGEARKGYFNKNRLTTATNKDAKVTYDHNRSGRLSRKTITYQSGLAKGMTFGYTIERNVAENVTKVTFSDGSIRHYTYYPNGSLKNITYTDSAGKVHDILAYKNFDSYSNPLEVAIGPHANLKKTFDPYNRLTSLSYFTTKNKSEPLLDLAYQYNAAGLLQQRTVNSLNQKYSYDLLGRLTSVSSSDKDPHKQFAYTYDKNSNLLSRNKTQFTISKTNNSLNSLRTLKTFENFKYDASGRMIQRKKEQDAQKFSYRADGRISSIVSDGFTASYGYDSQGKTIIKDLLVGEKQYSELDIGWGFVVRLMKDSSEKSIQKENYKYFPGHTNYSVRLLEREGKDVDVHYALRGESGSGNVILAGDGTVMSSSLYSPYGSISGPIPDVTGSQKEAPKSFNLGLWESQPELYQFQHRQYDPTVARFFTTDPVNQYSNSYSYTLGRPNFVADPSGLISAKEVKEGILQFITTAVSVAVAFVAPEAVPLVQALFNGADVAAATAASEGSAAAADVVGNSVALEAQASAAAGAETAAQAGTTLASQDAALAAEEAVNDGASTSGVGYATAGTLGLAGSVSLGAISASGTSYAESFEDLLNRYGYSDAPVRVSAITEETSFAVPNSQQELSMFGRIASSTFNAHDYTRLESGIVFVRPPTSKSELKEFFSLFDKSQFIKFNQTTSTDPFWDEDGAFWQNTAYSGRYRNPYGITFTGGSAISPWRGVIGDNLRVDFIMLYPRGETYFEGAPLEFEGLNSRVVMTEGSRIFGYRQVGENTEDLRFFGDNTPVAAHIYQEGQLLDAMPQDDDELRQDIIYDFEDQQDALPDKGFFEK